LFLERSEESIVVIAF